MHAVVGELLSELRRHCNVEEELRTALIGKVRNWKAEREGMMDIGCRLAVNALVADWSM